VTLPWCRHHTLTTTDVKFANHLAILSFSRSSCSPSALLTARSRSLRRHQGRFARIEPNGHWKRCGRGAAQPTVCGRIRYLGYSGLTPLLQLSYQVAPVISGFGQTLTLLFLKFCWFEETYQRVAVEPLRKSAPFAVFCMLYSHLTTMPCMLVDYLFIKDRVLLQALHPSLSGLAAIIVSYAAFYFLWVHMNHAINGGHYPYPFLYHFSPVGWVMFFFGIVIFLLSLLATQYALYNATMFIAG